MHSVPIYQAKNQLSELVAAVEGGAEISITRRGVPVARLVAYARPEEALQQASVAVIFEQLRALRQRIRWEGDLKEVAREGLD